MMTADAKKSHYLIWKFGNSGKKYYLCSRFLIGDVIGLSLGCHRNVVP